MSRLTNLYNEEIHETSVLATKSDSSLTTPVHREVIAYITYQFHFTILPKSKSFYLFGLFDPHIIRHELQELLIGGRKWFWFI
jgi:hypothetical protein